MTQLREGGCQCGVVRYRLEGEPLALAICHCTECQRHSGGAFGMSLVMRQEHFALQQGELKTFTRNADSGGTVVASFCPHCGTRIHSAPVSMPGIYNVKPGTLDDTSWLRPQVQVWTRSKQPWLQLNIELVSHERQPVTNPRRFQGS